MSDSNKEQKSTNTANRAPLSVRPVFESGPLEQLRERTEIEKAPVMWDLGVPMVGDRPAVDDKLLRTGKTQKERMRLSVGLDGAGNLSITFSNRHASRTELTEEPFRLPVISDVEPGSIFSATSEHPKLSSLTLSVARSGELELAGITPEGEALEFFKGDKPVDPDFERCVNIAQRMLVIPFMEGQWRAPIAAPLKNNY